MDEESSSYRSCLICQCRNPGVVLTSTNFNFTLTSSSSSKCSVPSKELYAYFLLRHVLELPSELLENYLRLCPDPGKLVSICQGCGENYVQKITRIFKELLEVKRRFNVARMEVIEAIRKGELENGKEGKRVANCQQEKEEEEPSCLDMIGESIRKFVITYDYVTSKANCGTSTDDADIPEDSTLPRNSSNCQENDLGHHNRPTPLFPASTTSLKEVKESYEVKSEPSSPPEITENEGGVGMPVEDLDSNPIGDDDDERYYSSGESDSDNQDQDWEKDEDSNESTEILKKPRSSIKIKSRGAPKPRLKCGLCPSSFRAEKTLRQHQIKAHKINLYECHLCNRKTTSESQLKEHIKRHHGTEEDLKELTCPKCGRLCSSKGSLSAHTSICQNPKRKKFRCEHCGMEFHEKLSYFNHLGNTHGIKDNLRFNCSFEGCGKSFFKKSQLLQHEDLHKPPQYECKFCGGEFKWKITLERHMSRHQAKDFQPFHCQFCPSKFSRNDNLKTHVKKCHNTNSVSAPSDYTPGSVEAKPGKAFRIRQQLKCSECELHFGRKTVLERHFAKMHPGIMVPDKLNIMCDKCKLFFRSNLCLRQHQIKIHKTNFYECKECEWKGETSGGLINHSKRLHGNKDDSKKTDSPTSSRKWSRKKNSYKCNKCEWKGKRIGELRSHLKRHHGNKLGHCKKPIPCPICSKVLTTMTGLRKHIFSRHNDNKEKIKCEQCDKELSSKESYLSHLRNMHAKKNGDDGDSRPFLCEFCPRRFKTNRILNVHVKNQHNSKNNEEETEEAGIVKCLECWRKFPNEKRMERHLEAVHQSEREVLPCPTCGKLFKSKYCLKNHIEIVHEKKYQVCCDICGKIMSLNSLKLHKSMVHKIGGSTQRVKCTVEGCSKTFVYRSYLKTHLDRCHGNNRSYQCDLCGKSMKTATHLRRHKEAMHSENRESKPFKCEQCGKGFATQHYLRYHQIYTHKKQMKGKGDEEESKKFYTL